MTSPFGLPLTIDRDGDLTRIIHNRVYLLARKHDYIYLILDGFIYNKFDKKLNGTRNLEIEPDLQTNIVRLVRESMLSQNEPRKNLTKCKLFSSISLSPKVSTTKPVVLWAA